MIHHVSLPVTNPRHVVEVLAKLLDGYVTRFGPYGNSYIAWSRDDVGTAIEVYPVGTEMFPDSGEGQANFRHSPTTGPFVATHVALSVNRSEEEVYALAREQGWRAIRLPRGGFDVIEFWIENHVMLEVLTPEMAADYVTTTQQMRLRYR